MSEHTVPEGEAWRFELPDQCPHCPEGVTIRRSLLDDHIAEAHADLPPCTARISNAGTGDQTVRCRFRVGHRDDSGGHHAGPYDERMGRLRWGDHAMGAVPHRPSDDTGRRCPRCDCSDGHTQCDHCKVCPHADGAPNEPTHITYEQLLPVVAAVHRREASAVAGVRVLLSPFPDCPTCGQSPAELAVRSSASFVDDRIRFAFRPCGHAFIADGEDLFRAYDHARRESP